MDVWSDKKRQNQERTHPRNDKSSAGVHKDNGKKTEMVWARHEDPMEEDHVVRRVMTKAIPGKRKRGKRSSRGSYRKRVSGYDRTCFLF